MIVNFSSSTAGGYNINCAGDSTGYIDIEPVNQVKTVDYLWADGIFGKTQDKSSDRKLHSNYHRCK